MLLNFDNGDPFATGLASYRYLPVPGSGDASRIIVQIEVDGDQIEAILDTGGGYFLCKPELAEAIGIDPAEALESLSITMKKYTIRGILHRIEIKLLHDIAENGADLPFEVTAFFPDPDQQFEKDFLPYSYLGMHCCMERIRFAVDPCAGEEKFYFGAHP
jgi:hypothetical protein